MATILIVPRKVGTRIVVVSDAARAAFYTIFLILLVLGALVIAVPLDLALTKGGPDATFDHPSAPAASPAKPEVAALVPAPHRPLPNLAVSDTRQWPIRGTITTEFGGRNVYTAFHTGIDIAASEGDPVHPFAEGVVIQAGWGLIGYGQSIIIDHGGGLTTVYAHLSKVLVSLGQRIEVDQVIGLVGHSGWTTGPHLHFQTNVNGVPVNPRRYL
jgi:murein DD-endopeptidase MepM/ murein hydrolase activator NlpD